jgi:hypothetical protein
MAEQDSGASPSDIQRAAELLPVVYAELRRLAVALSGGLPPGQTLQPTALVHEAYKRLVGDTDPGWNGRRHFFGAAARAMRDRHRSLCSHLMPQRDEKLHIVERDNSTPNRLFELLADL